MTVTCYPFTGSAWTESTAQWAGLTQSWDASMGVSLPISYSKGLEQPTDHCTDSMYSPPETPGGVFTEFFVFV